jgi:HSP20 family protein
MRMLSPFSSEWSRRGLTPDLWNDIFENFDGLVDSFVRPGQGLAGNLIPSCDIRETKEHFLVSFDMPGIKKDDIRIEVQGNQLLVSGERQRDMNEEGDESSLRHERFYGKYERTFTLPTSINPEKIEAHYEDGVLNIALPKAESAVGRKIQVQSGQSGGFFNKLLGGKKESGKENLKEVKDVKVS